jgi:hypothetical protein
MTGLLTEQLLETDMVEEIKHVNMHLNVPCMSTIDDYTYFKIIPYIAIIYEETSLHGVRIIARNLTVKG